MGRYTVQFTITKGSSSSVISATVEAETEYMAVMLAEGQLRGRPRSPYAEHMWFPSRIIKH